jgi:hypothetical protein
MSVAISNLGSAALELDVHGKLHGDDYRKFSTVAEQHIQEHGKISLLVRVEDLEGWTPAAFWQDLKFDSKHYGDVSRLAIVGREGDEREWMATLSRPFTSAEVEFFPAGRIKEARDWVAPR